MSMSEITYLPLDWGQHFNRLLWGALRSILYFILQTFKFLTFMIFAIVIEIFALVYCLNYSSRYYVF